MQFASMVRVLSVVSGLAVAAGAQAQVLPLVGFNTGSINIQGINTSVQLSQATNGALLTWRNQSISPNAGARITTIYIESTSWTSQFLTSASLSAAGNSGTVGYEAGGTPPTPGGGVNPWGGNFGIFSPRTPQAQNNAIGAGESLGVFIGFKNGMTYANFLAAAANQSNFRLIAHIQGVVNGQSIWSIGDNNSLIPTPGAAALLAGAGLLATRRRR